MISFHEAFDYAAEEYGFTICAEVLVGGKKRLLQKELTQVIDLVKQQHITIFLQQKMKEKICRNHCKRNRWESVSFKSHYNRRITKDAYLKAMEQNRNIIQEAIGL